MKNLQLVIEFTNHTTNVMTTEDVFKIDRALRAAVGASYEVSTLNGNRFTVMLVCMVPDDFNINTLENRLNLSLGDKYYQLFVVGDLSYFPITYRVVPSHKYPLENVEKDIETVMLKIAAAHAGARHDNCLRMFEWEEERGQTIPDDQRTEIKEEIERRCSTNPWMRVSPAMKAEWTLGQRTLSISIK